MKKYLFLLVILTAGLLSCGKDDKPVIPEMNKLTAVTCIKNDVPYLEYSLDIIYDQKGQIAKIMTHTGTYNFIYTGNKVSVIDGSNSRLKDYQMSGSVITSEEQFAINPYLPNEIYTQNKYTYRYDRVNLASTDFVFQRPLETGGYDTKAPVTIDRYTWENGSVSMYSQLPLEEVSYNYAGRVRPVNFPFRVLNTLQPVIPDMMSPLNFMYGAMNIFLPEEASRYKLGESGNSADYEFSYKSTGDYITEMTIVERLKTGDIPVASENVYVYTFAYDYVVK